VVRAEFISLSYSRLTARTIPGELLAVPSLKICSWNINGIRATIKTGDLQSWLATSAPDIVGMQEVKAVPEQVEDVWADLGYRCWWHPAERAGYSGTLLLSKVEPLEVRIGIGDERFDSEGRVIQADFPSFTLLNSYYPNAGRGVERMAYKLDFYAAFLDHVNGLRAAGKSLVFMGDFNIAHTEMDLARPEEALKGTGFLPQEREWISRIIANRYVDTFRTLHPDAAGEYSYWDAWRDRRVRNIGWRIDYVFVSENLLPRVKKAFIQQEIMGSDHCPVGIELEVPA
jgi:exodeoxyribonuclease-3